MRGELARSVLVAVGICVSAPLIGGCSAQAHPAVVVDAPPPPPRRVRVDARPGFVWVDGVWVSRGGRWLWRDGYWQRARPGYVYVQGRWIRRGSRWHWIEPGWQANDHVRGSLREGIEARDRETAGD